jgi:hypothetical protein
MFGIGIALLLLALNIGRSIQQHQVNTLYEPVYRWRQTFVLALSRMRADPPGGYLGFKSIENVFVREGFGIFPSEHVDMQRASAEQKDGAFLDRVIAEALTVPVDREAPPVLIRGNDLGWVDYVYFSFMLFGPHVSSLFYFYYLLLGLSTAIFLAVFWRSPVSLYVLSMYLVGHYLLLGYIKDLGEHYIVSVTNSRFYSAAAVLPALHILLVILRREAPTTRNVAACILQVSLLMFYVFCRLEAIWLPAMLVGTGVSEILFNWVRHSTAGFHRNRSTFRAASWATALVIAGSICLGGYMRYAPSPSYRSETRMHVIWHALYISLVSVLAERHPEIRGQYLYGNPPGSDHVAYDAVTAKLRARDDSSSPIAFRVNGTIYIDPMRDMGVYDLMVRTLYFEFIRQHPFLFVESLYDNVADEYDVVASLLRRSRGQVREAAIALGLSLSVALVFLGFLSPGIESSGLRRFAAGIVCFAGAALVPVVVVSDPLLCGTVLVGAILILGAVTGLPVLAAHSIPPLLRGSARRETRHSSLSK